jgi:Protein of unknown function (DUF4246)
MKFSLKRPHTSPLAGGQTSKVTPTSQPKRAKLEAEDLARVKRGDVEAIKEAIEAKPDWKRKVLDHEINLKYKQEALAQGASPATVAVAFRELMMEAVVASAASTLVRPSNDEDEDDDYYYNDEYDHFPSVRQDVFFRDGLVPESLRASLDAQLDLIANGPKKHFHPGTDNKVPPSPFEPYCPLQH